MRREAPSPTRRAALVTALAIAGAAVLWLGLSLGSTWRLQQARVRFAAVVGTVEPTAQRPEAPSPAEQDAIRWLFEGTAALTLGDPESEQLRQIIHREPGSWSPEDRETIAALTRHEAEALARLERAGALHGGSASVAIDDQRLLAEGTQLLRGSRLLLARAGLALDDGPSDAGRTLSALAGIARTLQADSGSAQQIFATTVEGLFLRGVHWMAEDPTVPAAVLADLLDSLSTTSSADRIQKLVAHFGTAVSGDPGNPPATWWARLEQASTLTTLRRTVEAGREPAALLAMAGPRDPEGATDPLGDDGLSGLAIPDIVDAALEMQAVEASRQLARVLLGLRIQAAADGVPELWLPWIGRRLEGAKPDPLAGGRPLVTADDGLIVISNPPAAEAWEKRWGSLPGGRTPPPFAWRLRPEILLRLGRHRGRPRPPAS